MSFKCWCATVERGVFPCLTWIAVLGKHGCADHVYVKPTEAGAFQQGGGKLSRQNKPALLCSTPNISPPLQTYWRSQHQKSTVSPPPCPPEHPHRPGRLSLGQQHSILPTLLGRLKLALIWIISNDPIGLSTVQRHINELVPATKANKLINEKIALVISVKQCKDVNASPMVSGPVSYEVLQNFESTKAGLGHIPKLPLKYSPKSIQKQGEGKHVNGTSYNYRRLSVTVWFSSQLTQSLTLVFKSSVILPLCCKISSIAVKYSSFRTINNFTIWREYYPIHCYILPGLQTGRGDKTKRCELHFLSLWCYYYWLFHCGQF